MADQVKDQIAGALAGTPTTTTGNRAPEAFVAEFEKKLDRMDTEREQGGSTKSPASTNPDRGKGKTAAAPAASARAETGASDTDDEEASSESPDDTAAEDDEEEAEDAEETSESDDDAADADAAEDDDEAEESEQEDEAEEEEPEEPEAEDAEGSDEGDDLVAEARAALERHGLSIKSVKDLPPAARPLVERKFAEMNAAMTRAMMEARAYRTEERQFRADLAYREQHPEHFIAEMLAKDPQLIEKINALVEKNEDPDKRKLFDLEVKQHRTEALTAVSQAEQKAEAVMQRADAIEAYLRTACTKLNLPFQHVVDVVELAILRKPTPEERERGLTDQELDQIITQQAKVLGRRTREEKRTRKQEAIRQRTRDRKTSTPAVRAGSGTPAGPRGTGKPKNDADFIRMMEEKL